MAFRDDVNRVLREHEGYSGDGKGGIGSLPIGDTSTARKPISKSDLRNLFLASEDSVDAAELAADRAEQAMADAQGATLYAADVSALLANPDTHPVGTIFGTRREHFSFEVVSSDPDLTTAGGDMLRALPGADGFVHVEQFGAVPDGDRLTGTGTDNTDAFRRAFATDYNIRLGWGTYAVTDTVQNLVENRQVVGAGYGIVNSAPKGDRLYFHAPSCILAIGDTATRRVITRRKYRASSADPNDPAMSAVIENWGMGSVFRDFSIELYCDYTDESPFNFGADWDIGFFNGCRSNVGCVNMSILGYFRKASWYWDVTDAGSIPNLLDIYGNPLPFPSSDQPDSGEHYGRASGADGCYMYRCEARGRLCRVILGADTSRTGGDYYDWVTDATYTDFRGGSGVSDFRSRDCSLRAEHHSQYRMQDPIGYPAPLTRTGMNAEDDFAPGVQYIDSWQQATAANAGPAPTCRGFILDDLRYVSREIFSTRLGQCKEVHFGPRCWVESSGMPNSFYDRSGNDIYADRTNSATQIYGRLATNEYTGKVTWPNTVQGMVDTWVYDWKWTDMSDIQGRRRAPDQGFIELDDDENGIIDLTNVGPGGLLAFMVGAYSYLETPLSGYSALLWYDVGSTPGIQKRDDASQSPDLEIVPLNTTLNNSNVTDGKIGISAHDDGTIHVRNRQGDWRRISWRVL